ncbi:MAG: cyclic-di-AMP receptor [Erysipelotrichaceae bacterium]
MKLMLIIVNEEDKEEVSSALSANNYQATMVSTSDDFLQYGNTTYLLGLDDHEVNRAVKLIEDNTTIRFTEEKIKDGEITGDNRAFLFLLDVYQYKRIEGDNLISDEQNKRELITNR